MMEVPEDILSVLKEIMICAVCLGSLPTDVGSCVNGHIFCTSCKNGVDDCPTCRCDLLDNKPTLVSQIIEAFPRQCKYDGCKVIKTTVTVKTHEKYCQFRQTECELCDWTGSVDELFNHTGSEHSLLFPTKRQVLVNFNFNTFESTIPSVYHETFFWRFVNVDPDLKKVNFKFTCVPSEELKVTFLVKVEFRSAQSEHIAKMNINADGGENVISFDADMLKPFISSDNDLMYFLSVNKIPK